MAKTGEKMRRRDFLSGALGTLCVTEAAANGTSVFVSERSISADSPVAPAAAGDLIINEFPSLSEALETFPFEIVTTKGDAAFRKWSSLKESGQTPIILGGDEDLSAIAFGLSFDDRTPKEILQLAKNMEFPVDLQAFNKELNAQQCTQTKIMIAKNDARLPKIVEYNDKGERRELTEEETHAELLSVCDLSYRPPIGRWPLFPPRSYEGPSVSYDVSTGRPLDTVYIALLPTDDWTEAPAYLKWGNWNANPSAEYHVSAFRKWRDDYGAELVAMSRDVVELRVTRRPKSRKEALALAEELYGYCPDIVEQGAGTLSALAAELKGGHWWFFWWD